jgi:hypothetical protein
VAPHAIAYGGFVLVVFVDSGAALVFVDSGGDCGAGCGAGVSGAGCGGVSRPKPPVSVGAVVVGTGSVVAGISPPVVPVVSSAIGLPN